MRIKNVLLAVLLIAGRHAWASGEHWTWNPYQYSENATFVSVITIDGAEQRSEYLEIGAFCDGQCRGSIKCVYEPRKDRYFAYMTLNGESGMVMTFRLWDHIAQSELDVTCDITYTLVADGYYGLPRDPYIFPFTTNSNDVVFNGNSTVYWSGAINWSGNALPGMYDNATISADCIMDLDVTVANLTISEGQTLTLQTGKTLTVTGTLTNTSISGLVIEDGAQLINASPNVGATMEKNIVAYSDSNPAGWYTIASPMDAMPIEGSDFLTERYDLYRFNETNLSHQEWENYEADHEDFIVFENGRGYLYANSNTFSPAFTGTLNANAVNCPLTYTERPDVLSGFNLIGNPFPHVIYKGGGGAIDNVNLASGYYTLTNEGAWHLHTFEDPIQPGQGILLKTSAATELTIAKSNAAAVSETGSGRALLKRMEVTVSGDRGEDRCFAYFSPGIGLDKMDNLSETAPSLSIRDNGRDYAIAHLDATIESMDLMFNNKQEGMFTIDVNGTDLHFTYLHLIDHITGTDVDLLIQPNYTFHATGHEYAARFMLVFRQETGVDESQEQSFCFVSGETLYVNMETDGGLLTLTDVLGRVVKSVELNGTTCSVSGLQPGVYIVRLTEGNKSLVQKIVINH